MNSDALLHLRRPVATGDTQPSDPRSDVVDGVDADEVAARAILPREVHEFVAGGAGAEVTLRANVAAFASARLVPRVLALAAPPDPRTSVLGTPVRMPVFVAPMSAHGLVHPSAECGSARGAADAGALFVAPTLSNRSLEEIAETRPEAPRWFQLYPRRDMRLTSELVRRAEDAGYRAIVLTVDQPVNGLRERDARNRFRFPAGMPFPNIDGSTEKAVHGTVEDAVRGARSFLTWDDADALRASTALPVVLKGILSVDDAEEAVRRGFPAIIVSNHGGRQLDGGLAALDALREIAPRVRGRMVVLMDGGVRRGIDVAKALALGASAVGIGRPVLWALAAGGADGVRALLARIHAELVNAMSLAGAAHPAAFRLTHVR